MSETSNSSLADPMSAKSPYMHLVKALGMPGVSAFGLAGNSMAVYILRQREVKLKREFVEVLCSLAAFDNLLLVSEYVCVSLDVLCIISYWCQGVYACVPVRFLSSKDVLRSVC